MSDIEETCTLCFSFKYSSLQPYLLQTRILSNYYPSQSENEDGFLNCKVQPTGDKMVQNEFKIVVSIEIRTSG